MYGYRYTYVYEWLITRTTPTLTYGLHCQHWKMKRPMKYIYILGSTLQGHYVFNFWKDQNIFFKRSFLIGYRPIRASSPSSSSSSFVYFRRAYIKFGCVERASLVQRARRLTHGKLLTKVRERRGRCCVNACATKFFWQDLVNLFRNALRKYRGIMFKE